MMTELGKITAGIVKRFKEPPWPKLEQYLGDSVYVDFDGRLILTTQNGWPTDPSNRIVLEGEVWEELKRYVTWLEREAAKP